MPETFPGISCADVELIEELPQGRLSSLRKAVVVKSLREFRDILRQILTPRKA